MRTAPAPWPRRRWLLSTGVSIVIMGMIVFVMHDVVPQGSISLIAESVACEGSLDACAGVPTP